MGYLIIGLSFVFFGCFIRLFDLLMETNLLFEELNKKMDRLVNKK